MQAAIALRVFREAEGRPTLATTNLTGAEFRQRYGDRLVSRLNAHSELLGWQVLDGPNLRREPPELRPQ